MLRFKKYFRKTIGKNTGDFGSKWTNKFALQESSNFSRKRCKIRQKGDHNIGPSSISRHQFLFSRRQQPEPDCQHGGDERGREPGDRK
jgi:hypothetical protein